MPSKYGETMSTANASLLSGWAELRVPREPGQSPVAAPAPPAHFCLCANAHVLHLEKHGAKRRREQMVDQVLLWHAGCPRLAQRLAATEEAGVRFFFLFPFRSGRRSGRVRLSAAGSQGPCFGTATVLWWLDLPGGGAGSVSSSWPLNASAVGPPPGLLMLRPSSQNAVRRRLGRADSLLTSWRWRSRSRETLAEIDGGSKAFPLRPSKKASREITTANVIRTQCPALPLKRVNAT